MLRISRRENLIGLLAGPASWVWLLCCCPRPCIKEAPHLAKCFTVSVSILHFWARDLYFHFALEPEKYGSQCSLSHSCPSPLLFSPRWHLDSRGREVLRVLRILRKGPPGLLGGTACIGKLMQVLRQWPLLTGDFLLGQEASYTSAWLSLTPAMLASVCRMTTPLTQATGLEVHPALSGQDG